ncbi:hypothetical protein MRB53_013402 [Persea americana]|uniref:Uncharacterized protein n=1 Tax=Persea americana TaxID=3435 RepID=A0ACC2K7Z2_PERAE|nr:hypothetical protein MRB53_013402 [Persea americana]
MWIGNLETEDVRTPCIDGIKVTTDMTSSPAAAAGRRRAASWANERAERARVSRESESERADRESESEQRERELFSDGKLHHQEDPREDTETPQLEKPLPSFHVQSPLLRPERAGRLFGAPKIGNCLFPEDHEPWRKRILDPESELILQWNRVFFISCLVALFIDPLHFFLPSVWILGDSSLCMGADLNLRIAVTILRTIVDMFYLLHMVIKFRTAYVAPSSRIFGRGELVTDPKKIAIRYLRSNFFIDLAAMLPLPQFVVWFIIPAIGNSHPIIAVIILLQYVARFCLISPVSPQIVRANGVVMMTAWAGAAYNLLLYTLASNFIKHMFACFFFSSYGQNLSTTTYIGETSFTIVIVILGLILFAHLIGNMQKYLVSLKVRVEQWRLKRKDSEEWMKHRQLPQDLRERVRRFVQYKWLATQGVDEESILRFLPPDLRREIQRHLCLNLVKRVPFFAQMADDQLLDAICERLVSSLSIEGTYIVREGDPLTQMLFIIRGRLESSTTDGGRTGFFNSTTLWPGDFCGEELLTWALHPKSTLNLPSSTRTVRAIVEVEAFALHAQDLKFVANQFRRLHSKKLQHTFRFYSHQWRTWAACFIQAGWRRYKRRKIKSKDKRLQESLSFDLAEHVVIGTKPEDEEMESPLENPSLAKQNLGVKIMLSTFVANRKRKAQRPEEPDFSAEHDKDD